MLYGRHLAWRCFEEGARDEETAEDGRRWESTKWKAEKERMLKTQEMQE